MAGGIATTLLVAAGRRGRSPASSACSRWTSCGSTPLAAQLHPRAILLGNLFRDQLDRYGELETIADSWEQRAAQRSARRARAERRRPAGRRPRPRAPARRSTSASRTTRWRCAGMAHAADAKHCRRCGAPYVFDAVYLGHLGHYHCPSCGQRAARRRRSPPASVRARGRARGALHAAHARRRGARSRCGCPGLYNVYNALAAAALATRAGGRRWRAIVAGLRAREPAFGRAESVTLTLPTRGRRRPIGSRELRILLVKNPAGANEVLRTLALEPGEHDLLGVLNDNIADGRDVSWIWDADFELLAGRVRRVTCSGTRAAELALRLKYAGIDPARIHVQADLVARARRGRRRPPRAPDTPLYALPTYTAMLALRELLVARGEAQQRMGVTLERRACSGRSGTTSSAAPTRADLPLWRELADARRRPAGEPVLDVGAGHRPGRARPRPRRPPRDALELDAGAARGARASARPALAVETVCADARTFELDRARLRPVPRCRCRRSSCSAAARSGSRSCARPRAPASRRPARVRDRHRGRALRLRRRRPRLRRPRPPRRRGRSTSAARRACAWPRARSGSSASADRPRGDAGPSPPRSARRGQPERDVIELDRLSAAQLEREAAAPGCVAAPAARDPADRRARRAATVVMLRA